MNENINFDSLTIKIDIIGENFQQPYPAFDTQLLSFTPLARLTSAKIISYNLHFSAQHEILVCVKETINK